MAKDISRRCGVGKEVCEHYDFNIKESFCKVFADRTECSLSMKHRKQQSNTSKKKAKNNDGYNYSKPSWAQELSDEWDHYAWTADDF